MFSPAMKTWCDAIDAGRMTTWPELTSAQVQCRPHTNSQPMIKGHLDQNRKNKCSTKAKPPDVPMEQPTDPTESVALPNEAEQVETPTDVCPPQTEPSALKSHHLYADCEAATRRIVTNQRGRFITPSSSSNTDMLILYEYNSNFIHVEPMPSRSGASILAAYKRVHAMLSPWGL